MNRKTVALLALIALLASASSWLSRESSKPTVTPETVEATTSPDYFMRDFSAKVHDEQGKVVRSLSASNLNHFADEDTATLSEPKLVLYDQQSQGQWQMQAAQGRVTNGGNNVFLSGGVTLQRIGRDTFTLNTKHLHLQPAKGYVETDAAIEISTANSTFSARGMKIYINEQRLILLAEVRGKYVPNR